MSPVCLSHKEIKNGMLDQSKHAVLCVYADYLEMVVYVTSSDSRHLCFASRNMKFLLHCCLAVCHILSESSVFCWFNFFHSQNSRLYPWASSMPNISCVYGLQYDSYAALTSEEFHSTEKWIIYFFCLLSHLHWFCLLRVFMCESVWREKSGKGRRLFLNC